MSKKEELPPRYCACGCGEQLVRSRGVCLKRFAKVRYIKGHVFRATTKAYYASLAPDKHPNAKLYRFRDPQGREHEMTNLSNWVRENEHLFHDDRPHSKMSFGCRIADGLYGLLRADGKLDTYKGWTAINKE